VIPNGVDLACYRPRPDDPAAGALRKSLGSAGRCVWLLVGHGFHRKGVDTALRALARSRDRRSVLWIASRETDRARRLARSLGLADRVRVLGQRQDLPLLYAAADALLLPTRYDAFANACLEAAASGLAIVTSGANGAARWLGPAALCVEDPEAVEGFAAALDELADPGRREALGRAARARAETRSWERVAAELCGLYEQIRR